MKYTRDLSYFAILSAIILVLCCIPTSAYALSDDEIIVRIYPPDWPQPYPVLYPSLLPFEPSDIIGDGGQLNFDGIELGELEVLPERPRVIPPLEIDGYLDGLCRWRLDSYNLNSNSYEIEPSFDVTSYSTESSIMAIPEPATVLLLSIGTLALKRRKRA